MNLPGLDAPDCGLWCVFGVTFQEQESPLESASPHTRELSQMVAGGTAPAEIINRLPLNHHQDALPLSCTFLILLHQHCREVAHAQLFLLDIAFVEDAFATPVRSGDHTRARHSIVFMDQSPQAPDYLTRVIVLLSLCSVDEDARLPIDYAQLRCRRLR